MLKKIILVIIFILIISGGYIVKAYDTIPVDYNKFSYLNSIQREKDSANESDATQGMAVQGDYAYIARIKKIDGIEQPYMMRVNLRTGKNLVLGQRDLGHGSCMTLVGNSLYVSRNESYYIDDTWGDVVVYNIEDSTESHGKISGQIKRLNYRVQRSDGTLVDLIAAGVSYDKTSGQMIVMARTNSDDLTNETDSNGNTILASGLYWTIYVTDSGPNDETLQSSKKIILKSSQFSNERSSVLVNAFQSIFADSARNAIYLTFTRWDSTDLKYGQYESYVLSLDLSAAINSERVQVKPLQSTLSYDSGNLLKTTLNVDADKFSSRFEVESIATWRASETNQDAIIFNTNNRVNLSKSNNGYKGQEDFIALLKK